MEWVRSSTNSNSTSGVCHPMILTRDEAQNRHLTFSKRSAGLTKKAHELAVLCAAQVGLVIISGSGRISEYSSPGSSLKQIVARYMSVTQSKIDGKQVCSHPLRKREVEGEQNRMQRVLSFLQSMREEDLEQLSPEQLQQLEENLEMWSSLVRKKKNKVVVDKLHSLRHELHHSKALERQYERIISNRNRPRFLQMDSPNQRQQEEPAALYGNVVHLNRGIGVGERVPMMHSCSNKDTTLHVLMDESCNGEPELQLGLNISFDD